MEKDANYFAVGVFVSVTVLALVGFMIWLAGVHTTGDYTRYTILFTDPVSGLVDEAVVKYKGVDVGKVLDMRIAPERADLVKVDIEVKEETPVRAGTLAKVELQGITGVSYIELETDRGDTAAPRRAGNEAYPVLKGRGSALTRFFDDMPEMTRKFEAAVSAIEEFSRSGAKTVDSVQSLTDKLKEDPSQIINPPNHRGVEIPK
jgi:phospholipid/cholesterol/gamma-HCH transport system substrate-binding protein